MEDTNGLDRLVRVGDEVQNVRTGEWGKVLRIVGAGRARRLHVQLPHEEHPKWWKTNAVCQLRVGQVVP